MPRCVCVETVECVCGCVCEECVCVGGEHIPFKKRTISAKVRVC